jgi:hypothetical protein
MHGQETNFTASTIKSAEIVVPLLFCAVHLADSTQVESWHRSLAGWRIGFKGHIRV